MQQKKTIKIFLASSIVELHNERMALKDYISNSVRPIFKLDGVEIEIVGYEDMYRGGIGALTQDIIDDQIKECDILLFLFKSKAGKQTVHEFDVAREIQRTRNSVILVYFFDIPEEEKSKDLKNFQYRLKKEGFYWKRCKDTNELLSYFIMDLLYFERNLLGINEGSDIDKIIPSEKEIDILFAQYEQHKKDLAQLREKIHQDIDALLQQISVVKNDEKKSISARINKIIELYKIADRQATASDYDKEKYSKMLSDYAEFLYDYGLYNDAETVFLRQIALSEELYGAQDEHIALSYNSIGNVYMKQGDYSKALEYYIKALTINEKVFGTNHPETAFSCSNIGGVYYAQGNYDKALEYYFKALPIVEKNLGPEHPNTASSYNNIGLVYHAQGDYGKALEYYFKALAIREKVLGTEDPNTATSYNNIGGVYHAQGNYGKALEYYFKALPMVEKNLGPEHPNTATSYNNIGGVYHEQGDYDKALEYYFKALAIREKILGAEHPLAATSYNNIAGVYYAQGDYGKALEFYFKALEIYEKVFGKEHVYTASLYYAIGAVYDAEDDNPKALEYYNKAYRIREEKLGSENTDTKSTLEKIDNVNIVDKLKVTLLKSYHHLNINLLRETINDLCSCLNCIECSLWFFNYNSTSTKGKEEDVSSISLIHRSLQKEINYQFVKATDFVQEKTQHVLGTLSKEANSEKYFCRFNDVSLVIQDLISLEFVNKYKLTDFIIIPICDEDNKRIIAFFEISYSTLGYSDDTWKELSPIIQSFFSVAFQRFEIIQKQRLMEDLIKKHGELKDKDVESLSRSIVNDVLRHVCPFQAASLFMWDDYQNRYNLVATTGLTGVSNSNYNNVFYQKGEGITGTIGMNAKAIIVDALEGNHKSFEDLRDNAKTAMLIPICNPSNELEVVGILRIVNKTNVCNNSVIDYFNDTDVNLMLFASNYLALIIDHYQKEAIQYNFIDKLTHEIITPANAILKSAHRLYTHLEDDAFISKHLSSYLKNIMDFAELQRWQASTNLFLSRNRKKQPFEVRYSIKPTRLYEVIKKSIDIAIPIARKYNVPFDQIVIDSKSDTHLTINIDEDAFVTIFYNLFTNAIKYHDPNAQEQFYIEVSYFMGDYLIINVADNGIGIDEKDKNTIFENGFRSESAIRINATGYGIGLTVIKQIVEDFGGTISLANLRKPTVFQVKIPKNKLQ